MSACLKLESLSPGLIFKNRREKTYSKNISHIIWSNASFKRKINSS